MTDSDHTQDSTKGNNVRPGQSQRSPAVATPTKRSQQKAKPSPRAGKRKRKKKIKAPRARLLDLAARYKANHDQFQAMQQQLVPDAVAVPEGEFEIEQLLCSDEMGQSWSSGPRGAHMGAVNRDPDHRPRSLPPSGAGRAPGISGSS